MILEIEKPLTSLKGTLSLMNHPHRKLPENICPKCGATEGVSRVLNYYFCESCHQKQETEKQISAVNPPVSPR